jgi:hypothetical protein
MPAQSFHKRREQSPRVVVEPQKTSENLKMGFKKVKRSGDSGWPGEYRTGMTGICREDARTQTP